MTDIFQGDPRIFVDEDGAYLGFVGGQPVMDRGIENYILISLFTRPGWAGNIFLSEPIGSDYLDALNNSINRTMLINVENAAERALQPMKDNGLASEIVIEVRNPSSIRIDTIILVTRPSLETAQVLITKTGIKWHFQATDPAYRRFA
jgi:phage gp46-like protein